MVTSFAAQMEPIPGYTLIEPLGQGGFGEVWKAHAPGDIPKAIKFVHGDLDGIEAKVPAAQELKALNRVKEVRHPFILAMERVDVIDGQLIIVMELADRDIAARLKECQGQGLPGIPREELLRYMEEAAEALDLMNLEYGLQHLDIKPQNLFLVHNHVKIADFGLVKDLQGLTATVTCGITPVYAAPETFEGRVSRHSDQYSLAIVYQELLTGQRPYSGKNPRQLMVDHLRGEPDLTCLPAADRAIVARALAKQASDRFPSCGELVRALRKAPAVEVPAPAEGKPPPPPQVKDATSDTPSSRLSDSWLQTPTVKQAKATSPAFGTTVNPMSAAGAAQKLVEDVQCPGCGAALIDPGPREWCGSCGYGWDMHAGSLLGPEEKAPTWSWVVLGGLAVMAGLAVLAKLLARHGSLDDLGLLIPIIGCAASLGVMVVAIYLMWPSNTNRGTRQPPEL